MNNFKKGLAVVLAAATAFTFAPVANITAPAVAQAADTVTNPVKVTYKSDSADATAKTDAELGTSKDKDGKDVQNTNPEINIDTVAHKTETIKVTGNTTAAGFSTDNSTIATVNPTTGVVTAVKAGSAHITVNVGAYNYIIPVTVSDQGHDSVKAQVNGKDVTTVNLDVSNSTAVNAIKSVRLNGISESGLTVKYDLYTDNTAASDKIVKGNSDAVVTLGSDGTLTAGKNSGDRYVKVYTEDNNGRNIKGSSQIIKVTVNAAPEAIITSTVAKIDLDLKNNKTVDLSKIFSVNDKNSTLTYEIVADEAGENASIVTRSGNTLTAGVIGVAKLKVTSAPGTGASTRAASITIPVSVVDEIKAPEKKEAAITSEDYIRVTEGATTRINAASTATGAAISYQSLNPDVASVDANGIVTGLTSGVATIKVASAETAEAQAAAKNVVVIVDAKPVPVVTPGKVTNVKVNNAKGAKVTVTWDNQGGNILYRVYKKVGNSKKWSGKNVTGSKTSLSVKKGAKVTVKVKAYVKDATGKTTWGPAATKTKTIKTDKK